MSAAPIETAIEGGARAPLSRRQQVDLILEARRAFDALGGRDALGEPFESWRHRQQLECVEVRSLTAGQQQDFIALLAHFRRMVEGAACAGTRPTPRVLPGASAEALRMRGETDDLRRARWCLEREVKAAEDAIPEAAAYAARIAWRRWQSATERLDERMTWALIFTLRRRAQQMRAKRRAI